MTIQTIGHQFDQARRRAKPRPNHYVRPWFPILIALSLAGWGGIIGAIFIARWLLH